MKTKIATAILTLSASLFAGSVLASHDNDSNTVQNNVSYDYATVIDAQPIMRTIRVSTPREECWQEQVVYERQRSSGNHAVGTVVGGVLGGALGNAVGHKKSNKRVGAVVGAVLGATLGNAIASNNSQSGQSRRYGTEERCKVYQDAHEEERVIGYQVRYRYHDQTYSTRMDTRPGDTIKVRMAISPVI
jgi:uncharacterized protein YcfJ